MESGKQSSKKIPKKRRSLRINMPVSRWSISKFPQLPKIRRVQWVSASTHRFSHFVCIFFGIVVDRSPLSQLPFSALKCSVTSPVFTFEPHSWSFWCVSCGVVSTFAPSWPPVSACGAPFWRRMYNAARLFVLFQRLSIRAEGNCLIVLLQ